MTRFMLGACLPCLLFTAGCGYRSLGYRAGGPGVDFPALRNLTREPAVEAPLTGAIARELLRAGFSPGSPGAVYRLRGAVTGFEVRRLYRPREYAGASVPSVMTARLRMELSALPGAGREVPPGMETLELEETRYFQRVGPFADPESAVLEKVAGALAKRVVEWLLEMP